MESIEIIQKVALSIALSLIVIRGTYNIMKGNFDIGLIQSAIAMIGQFIISR